MQGGLDGKRARRGNTHGLGRRRCTTALRKGKASGVARLLIAPTPAKMRAHSQFHFGAQRARPDWSRRRCMRGRGDRIGGRLVVHFRKPRPDVRVYVLGLLGRRRQSCADGPHWLVCDDNLAHFLLGHSRKSLACVQHPAHSMPHAQHQAHTVIQRTSALPLPLLTPSSYRAATAAKSRAHSLLSLLSLLSLPARRA